jgi:cardiolipin synthase
MFMKLKRRIKFFIAVLSLAVFTAFIVFIFNPLGLGPEPMTVLPQSFFKMPAEDLNQLELLIGGEEAVEKIREEILGAGSSVYMQMFIWKDDDIGRRLVNALKSLAASGVKVTISKDILGSFFELGDMLNGRPSPVYTAAGLKGLENIKVKTDFFADNDHSKFVIIDRQVVAFGGMNVADEYHLHWHDYMALIRDRRWSEAFEERVLRAGSWPEPAPFVVTVNDRKATEVRTAYIQMIDSARERVIIEHAYFSDDRIIEALQRALKRGIEVDVILPEKPDTHGHANRVTINRLLESPSRGSMRIFLYPRMSHAKVALVDGVMAAIGSANLTPRSMVTTREVVLFVHGTAEAGFISRLRRQLEDDIKESRQVNEPFKLGPAGLARALVGKYLW